MVGAKASDQFDCVECTNVFGRDGHHDAQRDAIIEIEFLPRAAAKAPLKIVDAGHAERVCSRLTSGDGTLSLDASRLGQGHRPGIVLATDGLATTEQFERAGAEPEGVMITSPERCGASLHGPIKGGSGVCDVGQQLLGPAPTDQPISIGPIGSIGGSALGNECQRGLAGWCSPDIDAVGSECPGQKVHVGIHETGYHGAALEIDSLVRDRRAIALPGLDAAGDASTVVNWQATDAWDLGVAGIDGAAMDNHTGQRSAARRHRPVAFGYVCTRQRDCPPPDRLASGAVGGRDRCCADCRGE